jgi:signal transduction histidine kinase
MSNLIDNAIKFGGHADLVVAETPDGVSISVLDQGPGIPPEQLDRVFDPFFRVEGSRSRDTGGTGLGLAIAQQLNLALGGRLCLSNRANGGLLAHLILPRP